MSGDISMSFKCCLFMGGMKMNTISGGSREGGQVWVWVLLAISKKILTILVILCILMSWEVEKLKLFSVRVMRLNDWIDINIYNSLLISQSMNSRRLLEPWKLARISTSVHISLLRCCRIYGLRNHTKIVIEKQKIWILLWVNPLMFPRQIYLQSWAELAWRQARINFNSN